MSLDERVRAGLRSAAERGGLDTDDVLASVELAHARGVVRSRRVRRAASIGVALALFAGVASVVSWRAGADHSTSQSDAFRSTATLRIAPAVVGTPTPLKLSDPRALALAASTRRAALTAADLAPDDAEITFRATLNSTRDVLSLAATAPTASESTTVTRSWALAFAKARRSEARATLRARMQSISRRITALRKQLTLVDGELVKVDPITYHDVLSHDARFLMGAVPSFPSSPPKGGGPPVPQVQPAHELNLANERIQILSTLADLGRKAASLRITGVTPQVYATIIGQTPAVQVRKASHPRSHALVWWIVTLVILLPAGVLVLYLRRTRSLRQVPA